MFSICSATHAKSIGQIFPIGFVAFAAVSIFSATTARAQTVEGVDEGVVRHALAAAHRDYASQRLDPFAASAIDPTVLGRRFRLHLALKNGNSATGDADGPYYTYEDGVLTLQANQATGAERDAAIKIQMLEVGAHRLIGQPYTGVNSFGARAVIHDRTDANDFIAFNSAPEGMSPPPFKKEQVISEDFYREMLEQQQKGPKTTYWVKMNLPGPQARAVVADADLVVEGVVAKLPSGKLSGCDFDALSATVASPEAVYVKRCWLGADVSRVAFIRRSSGEVLASWPAAR